MTKEQHKNLRIGDHIRKIDKKLGDGIWRITSEHTARGFEYIVSADIISRESKIWCAFTLSNERADLHKYSVIIKEENPEYFL